MAQRLQNITVGAPGFKGVNTQDSPIGLDPQFASVANNCVIDRFGRLGARKGHTTYTAVIGQQNKLRFNFGGSIGLVQFPVKKIAEWNRLENDNEYFVAANKKIFWCSTGSDEKDELTEVDLPLGYTISGDEWDIIDFNGSLYFFQAGHDPLVMTETSFATNELVTLESQSTDSSPVVIQAPFALGAYGRMWVACPLCKVIYWSDTLIPANFEQTGSSFAGSLDTTLVWPDGFDKVTGLAAFNGKLIIFGEHSVIVYTGAEDPTTMVLEDAFSGVGCLSHFTIKSIGNDILYLSDTGVRSLSRAAMAGEAALPDSDISNNIRQDLLDAIDVELGKIETLDTHEYAGLSATYSPEEALYLLHLHSTGDVYAFDTRGRMPDGTFRVTTWYGSPFHSSLRSHDGQLYVGGIYGLGLYSGYIDGEDPYQFSYESPVLTFGNNAGLKFIKSLRATIIGGSGQTATLSWGYGFEGGFKSQTIDLGLSSPAEFGVAEYNTSAEFSGGSTVTDKKVNATGSGRNVRLKLTSNINGAAFSLQEINVQALLGRIL